MAQLGFRTINEMVGRVDMLSMQDAIDHYKAKGLDYSMIFHQPKVDDPSELFNSKAQANPLREHLDWTIIKEAKATVEEGKKTELKMPIKNTDRTIGTILSNRLVKKFGPDGLSDDTLKIEFTGSAGQSFGAFLTQGVTLKLIGDSNDYLGKGLSAAKLSWKRRPDRPSWPMKISSSATLCSMAPLAVRPLSTAWPASGSVFATAAPQRSSKVLATTGVSI